MFSNVGLNIFIGVVFIYLLYSLLATIVAEIIATQLGIRALNLKEAVDRMLSDAQNDTRWKRLIDTLKLLKNPENERIDKFYNNPEIKYLGSTGIFKIPSSFKSETFSRTLLYELNGSGMLDRNNIEAALRELTIPPPADDKNAKPKKHGAGNNSTGTILPDENAAKPTESVVGDNSTETASTNDNTDKHRKPQKRKEPKKPGISDSKSRTLDTQSAQFVLSLFHYSNGDLDKFKLQLEAWFDRTMDQATEWYKRKIQFILVVLGFFMAWIFNASTFSIISKLSADKDAREQLVQMAAAHLQSNKRPGEATDSLTKEDKDNIRTVEKKLQDEVAAANGILGSGSWLPDSVTVTYDPQLKKNVYSPQIDEALLCSHTPVKDRAGTLHYHFDTKQKLHSFFWLFLSHFWGFLVTALAISLGAPFWFDMLNKLMQLRTSIKVPTDSTDSKNGTTSPLNRIG